MGSSNLSRRDGWRKVLDAEVQRWSALSCDELISVLRDDQAYEVEFESKKYQVEVELLENTEQYLNVIVAIDDFPASIRPLCQTFIRSKP
jgi:hypothetical protein